MMEVEMGKMAQKQAKNADVKKFGTRDGGRSHQSEHPAEGARQEKGVTLEASSSENGQDGRCDLRQGLHGRRW